jgi:hypothetical protein
MPFLSLFRAFSHFFHYKSEKSAISGKNIGGSTPPEVKKSAKMQ